MGCPLGFSSWGCHKGLEFVHFRARCGSVAAAWVTGALAAPGTQGHWQLGQQEIPYSRRVWHSVFAKTLQYSCLENPFSDRESWQATVYRVPMSQTRPKWPWAPKPKTFFLPVAALPQWELSLRLVQLLGLQGPWWSQVFRDTNCLHSRSYGPIRVFFRASCSWQSEGLFGQSFSVALPVQALKGIPCLGSFFVVQHIRHIEGLPLTGVLLCSSAHQSLKGSLWLGSYSSSVCQAFDWPAFLLFSCWCWCVEREAMCDSAVSPCFDGCLAFLHRHFPPWSPPSHPLDPSCCSQQQP